MIGKKLEVAYLKIKTQSIQVSSHNKKYEEFFHWNIDTQFQEIIILLSYDIEGDNVSAYCRMNSILNVLVSAGYQVVY